MHSELKQILTIEDLFDLYGKTSTIDFYDQKIDVTWLKAYQSDQTKYHSQYALLNEHVLIISSSGAPSPYDIRKTSEYLQQIHVDRDITNAEVIWDVRNIANPGIKVRKAVIKSNNILSQYWKSRYLVIPPKYRTLIRIYKFIYQGNVEDLHFADSIEGALQQILLKVPDKRKIDYSAKLSVEERDKLLGKSKEELVDIIENNRRNSAETTSMILKAIGQMSWEGRFQKIELETDAQDPHFELVNAFWFLQQDVAEIIKEYKDLNQNLELKVAERIVDFIDKESNLRAILDNSDRVTWLMNTRFELIDFNAAFSDEMKKRYSVVPRVNQNILDFLKSEKEKNIWKERFESALIGKPSIYLDQESKNGIDRVVEIKVYPIKEIGKIKGVSVFIEDITQLKDSEFKLIEKNRDLQKVNSELDSFVYRVSHDLRAPLTSILGLINLMKIETNQEKIGEYIDLQEKSIQKLDLFIKEIINLSRNSRLGITAGRINFQEMLDEVFESQHFAKTAENVEQICIIDENLEFYTDRQRLSIILNNLISNGLKYSNKNQEEPFVKVNVYPQNGDCVIEVSDNGIGISDLYLPKIFEMFFRATQEFNGSGLGLYIVKETVEKLKGKIKVSSVMRKGTTFKVVLPNLKDRYDAAPKLDD